MSELGPDERAELEALRRESAQRREADARRAERERRGEATTANGGAARAARGGGLTRGGRWVVAVVVLTLASVLSSLAVVAVYLRSEVLDTDTYVEPSPRSAATPRCAGRSRRAWPTRS